MKSSYRTLIPILAMVILFGFVFACTDGSDQEEKEYTTEYKLAVIDKGGYLEEDDLIVTEYKRVLNSLEGKVINDEVEIGDIVVTTQEILREDYNINLSILKIMKDLDASIPDDVENLDLEEIATAYIVLLVSG